MDRKLIDMINSGRCFAFIGSGPSCEVGYPTWHEMAEYVRRYIKDNCSNYDDASYKKYITQKKYAEMFTVAEDDLGKKKLLVDLIKEKFENTTITDGNIYKILLNWPFACYLTTNYDDEINKNLKKIGITYQTYQNKREDFYNVEDGMKNIILKLHSDLNNPSDVVITSRDYSKLYADDSCTYFRTKLSHLFEMFNIIIVGYSLYDIDIRHVLEIAKNTINPYRPIYMFASDVTKSEIKEYYDKFNITIIPYKRNGDKHDELIKILNMIKNFVEPRGNASLSIDGDDALRKSDIASALFLHRNSAQGVLKAGIDSIILYSLHVNGGKHEKNNLLSNKNINFAFSSNVDIEKALEEGLRKLLDQKSVEIDNNIVCITEKGKDEISEIQTKRTKNKELAYKDFIDALKHEQPSLDKMQEEYLFTLAEKTITLMFEKRGHALADRIFANTSVRQHDLSSIFESIYSTAQDIEDSATKYAFINAMFKFSLEPTDIQKNYMASLSQGFFLYHAIGSNPNFYSEVNNILKNNLWIYDSNILIPLIATGSTGCLFANNLVDLMKENYSITYTTYNIIREVFSHYNWCVNFVNTHGSTSVEFLRNATIKSGYKQNLFIDGYINEYAIGSVSSFRDYSYKCFKTYNVTFDIVVDIIKQKNIIPIDNYSDSLVGRVANLEEIKEIIREEREKRNSYRSDKQVETDAELIAIINEFYSNKIPFKCDRYVERMYVVSQGKLFEHQNQNEFSKVWPPEQLYKLILSISEKINNAASIWDGIVSEYYNFGFPYINKKNYTKFFGQQIDQAKLSYEDEKGKYIAESCGENIKRLDEEFYKVDDLEKPLFVDHMGWKVAESNNRKAVIAQEHLAAAEAKIKVLEAEKSHAWKKKQKIQYAQKEAEIRNAKDPQYIAKRRRQAKKREKNKK